MYKYLFIIFCFTTQAYEFATWNDVPTRWETPTITYSTVAPLIPESFNIVTAMGKWTEATDGYIKFIPVPENGDIVISLGKRADRFGGITYRTMNDDTKRIIHVDIEFGSIEALTVELMLHELGHALGLTHSGNVTGFSTPTLSPQVDYDDKWLHKDDVDGIRELYGLSPKSVVHFEVTRIKSNLYRFVINDTPYSTVYAKGVRGLRDVPCSLRKKAEVEFKVRGYTGKYILCPKDLNLKLRKSIKFDVIAD